MGNDDAINVGVAAAVACATGSLWSIVAGRSDPSDWNGVSFTAAGCVGSATNAVAVYGVTRYAGDDPVLARHMTAGWLSIQSAASLTNWIGDTQRWHNSGAFTAVAFPLNFAAAPLSALYGLGLAGIGAVDNGFGGQVHTYGGALVFHHNMCPGFYNIQTGVISHQCGRTRLESSELHERGHMIQSSIMGDIGTSLVFLIDHGQLLLREGGINHFRLTLEKWATRYSWSLDP